MKHQSMSFICRLNCPAYNIKKPVHYISLKIALHCAETYDVRVKIETR